LTCKICDREAGADGFCVFHERAHENILRSYAVWKKGLNIPWKDYLTAIKRNCLTGEWAKEVAEYMIKKEEMGNVETS
jgi:hypothetical protein